MRYETRTELPALARYLAAQGLDVLDPNDPPSSVLNVTVPGFPFAVLDPIEPGYSVRIPTAPVFAARAVEAEPDDAENRYAQEAVESSDTYRPDADRMEHERQSRLHRWQAQP